MNRKAFGLACLAYYLTFCQCWYGYYSERTNAACTFPVPVPAVVLDHLPTFAHGAFLSATCGFTE